MEKEQNMKELMKTALRSTPTNMVFGEVRTTKEVKQFMQHGTRSGRVYSEKPNVEEIERSSRSPREYNNLIDLIYSLNQFSLDQISDQYLSMTNRDPSIFRSGIKDRILELCDIGTLSYDGSVYKVIPAEERLSYRKFMIRGHS